MRLFRVDGVANGERRRWMLFEVWDEFVAEGKAGWKGSVVAGYLIFLYTGRVRAAVVPHSHSN